MDGYNKLLIYKYSNLEYLEQNDLLMDDHAFDLIDKLSKDNEMPHIIFYGGSGVGKKTIIQKLLLKLYGDSIKKVYTQSYEIEQPCGKKKSVDIIQSQNHIIINPNKNNADRILIQQIVKEYTKYPKICMYENMISFKIVQIQNIDNLTFSSQTVLRRLIEKKSKSFRFLFWCKTISSVSDPIRSRCMLIHIKPKTNEVLKEWIRKICTIENIDITEKIISSIIKKSEKNIKSILLLLDIYKKKHNFETSYDDHVNVLLAEIYGEFNIKNVRDMVYDIIKNIPVTKLVTDIFEICLINTNNIDKEKYLIDQHVEYMNNLKKGRREIIHVETYFKFLHIFVNT